MQGTKAEKLYSSKLSGKAKKLQDTKAEKLYS